MPKVSVIIPAYNAAETLAEAIESVLTQTFRDFEIILIDDGSTDATTQVVQQYNGQITYVCQENHGPAAARNRGLQLAAGKYLAFLDADDLLLPAKLEVQTRFLDLHPEIDIVYSNGYCFWSDDRGRLVERTFEDSGRLNKNLNGPAQSLPILIVQNAFPIHAALARKECICQVDGFDEHLPGLEDQDLWVRLASEHQFAYLEAFVARYRIVESGITGNLTRQKNALKLISQKIESSSPFKTLSAEAQADFYFSWGTQELSFAEPQAGREKFRQAMHIDPGNWLAFGAWAATCLFGKDAVFFYNLKRRLFGPHSS